jgi:hypothetical protein
MRERLVESGSETRRSFYYATTARFTFVYDLACGNYLALDVGY